MSYVTMTDLSAQIGNVSGLCDPPETSPASDGSKDMVKLAATLGIGLLVGTFVLRRMFGWAY